VLTTLLSLAVLHFRRETDKTFTYDAVLCISGWVSGLYLDNPEPSAKQVEDCIIALNTASITHVMLDGNGKPLDLYGTPFRIRREARGNRQTVIATSAGPDRRFDTEDDLRAETTTELPDPKKP
jgi:hypothetical protein